MRAATLLVTLSFCAPLASQAQQAPPRDTVRRAAPVGSGSIAGYVLLDDDQPKALRRARVVATGTGLPDGRTLISRDDGSFRFDGLPAGRYTVRAAKEGYVALPFGGPRSSSAGTTIALHAGEAVRGIRIRLPRGAVIGGLILDGNGQPIPGSIVRALAWRFLPGAVERRLVPMVGDSTTDDRGEYRLYGLPAGEYVVVTAVHPPTPLVGSLQVLADAEIRRAMSELRQTSTFRSRPGLAPPPPSSPTPALPRRAVAYAPMYFPGTAALGSATLVSVGRGEERLGVDIRVEPVPTAIVSGSAVFPDASGASVDVVLSRSDRATADEGMRMMRARPGDGQFSFNAVPPGRYTVFATAHRGQRSGGAPPIGWAHTDIVVDGEDLSGVFVAPVQQVTIAGRVAFDGATGPPANLSDARMSLPAMQPMGSARVELPPAQLDAEGRFSIDVLPGRYQFASILPGTRSPLGRWFLSSVTMHGREVLDAPLEFQQRAEDVVVTFADRATELSGTAFSLGSDVAADGYVIVFSSNPGTWFPYSRRVAAAQPRDDGTFIIRNLPPGEYFAVATADVDAGEWHDPALLERLSTGAVRLTLGPAEKKIQDLRMRSP